MCCKAINEPPKPVRLSPYGGDGRRIAGAAVARVTTAKLQSRCPRFYGVLFDRLLPDHRFAPSRFYADRFSAYHAYQSCPLAENRILARSIDDLNIHAR